MIQRDNRKHRSGLSSLGAPRPPVSRPLRKPAYHTPHRTWHRQLQDKIQAKSQMWFLWLWFLSIQLNKSRLFKLIHLQTLASIQCHQRETMGPMERITSVVYGLLWPTISSRIQYKLPFPFRSWLPWGSLHASLWESNIMLFLMAHSLDSWETRSIKQSEHLYFKFLSCLGP